MTQMKNMYKKAPHDMLLIKNIALDNVDEKTCIIIKTSHLMMQMKKTCIIKNIALDDVDEKNMYYKNIALDDVDEKHVL